MIRFPSGQLDFFLLENVESIGSSDDDSSNHALLLEHLREKTGFLVQTKNVVSDTFGLPQARSRYYFFGLRQGSGSPFGDCEKAMAAIMLAMNYFRMPPLPFQSLFEPSDSQYCQDELARRLEIKRSTPG